MATSLQSEVAVDATANFNGQALGLEGPQRSLSDEPTRFAQEVRDYAMIVQSHLDSCQRVALRCTLDEMKAWLPDLGVDPDPQVMIHSWTIGYIDDESEDIFVVAGNTAGLRNLLAQALCDSIRHSPRHDILDTLCLRD